MEPGDLWLILACDGLARGLPFRRCPIPVSMHCYLLTCLISGVCPAFLPGLAEVPTSFPAITGESAPVDGLVLTPKPLQVHALKTAQEEVCSLPSSSPDVWGLRLGLSSWALPRSPSYVYKYTRLETPEETNAVAQVQRLSAAECPCDQGRSVFCSIQCFNLLDEAHPHYGGHSALFKVH